MLLDRDCHLSLILEGSLRDAIQADTSGLGVDRAIQVVWPSYRPSLSRWDLLQSPNSRWLVCETAPSGHKRSQMVHVNILDGSVLIDGKLMSGGLPSNITSNPMYCDLFDNVCSISVSTAKSYSTSIPARHYGRFL